MPDIQNFSVTGTGNSNGSLPTRTVQFRICNSRTGAVIRDFTGVNSLAFPGMLSTLTAAQRARLLEGMIEQIIQFKIEEFGG